MDWQTLIIQLGISGLVVFVAYQIAMKWMTLQREAEKERSKVTAEAEAARTLAIKDGFAADIAAHNEITRVMQKMQNQNYRMESKLDVVLDLTPVRGIARARVDSDNIPMQKSPTVIVDMKELDDDTPVDRPPAQDMRTPKPRASSDVGLYGLRDTPQPKKR